MVTEGSTAMQCAAELSEVMIQHFEKLPAHFYAYTDGKAERKVDTLSVQKFYNSVFLKSEFDEILVARTAAKVSYRNPVERCHSIADLGLQTTGTMNKKMFPEIEKVICNVNSNNEIRKLCSCNKQLEKELKVSLPQPKPLTEQVFKSLSLKGSNFKIFPPSTNASAYSNELTKASLKNILPLNLRSDFTKTKYPKFYDFYTKHCLSLKYHFHVFKCLQPDCEWLSPIKSGKIEYFGEPNGVTDYVQGSDPTESLYHRGWKTLQSVTMAYPSCQLHKQL